MLEPLTLATGGVCAPARNTQSSPSVQVRTGGAILEGQRLRPKVMALQPHPNSTEGTPREQPRQRLMIFGRSSSAESSRPEPESSLDVRPGRDARDDGIGANSSSLPIAVN